MRVRHLRNVIWSDWSATLPFGVQEEGYSGAPVALAMLVLGAVALPTLVMFVCKRYSVTQRLFPPIPQVKGELASIFIPNPEVSWEGTHLPPGSQEPEDILIVEETP
ncbi:granulocyte-macrophage colony-stimulating factor receptor subunit alpha-like isoform X2 [Nycticebus coucang]|uniref:granulocyte-macrophage colony-stimulating factor receptor subunit alpha-like isoform X2 n=1 Tax=Nycticebus coucang TaxID=9470 RepID=UPI00234C1F85|nr:granulocyte-macrophage colony-stimulating factor receptor subunit alpha-like isoform X2 [Nycticebus coucang]